MSTLELEPGDEQSGVKCQCCGKTSTIVHGFVYSAGEPFAVYYAGWSIHHPELGIKLAIATGEWGEDSTPANRVSMGFSVHATASRITFTALDPSETPWGETPLFGKMISRASALVHSAWARTIEVAELIVQEDSRVHDRL